MTLEDRNRAKQRCFRHLLDAGVTALHFDARAAGVQVPEQLRSDPWLVLNYSYRYNVADFTFDDKGVQASLTFGGRPHLCFVPWKAVFAITDDARTQGQHWQEDLPTDAHRAAPAAKAAKVARVKSADADALPDTSNEAPARHGLRAIDGGRQEPAAAEPHPLDQPAQPEDAAPAPPRATGHLRRVK